MPPPLVSVIILNHNRTNDVLACLESLFQSDYADFQVLLIDSLSSNHFVETVAQKYPQIQVIPLATNWGYAGNNNIGIQTAMEQGAEWMLILNNDTVLDRSCLSRLIEAGESDPKIGIVGPMVYHFDEPNVI